MPNGPYCRFPEIAANLSLREIYDRFPDSDINRFKPQRITRLGENDRLVYNTPGGEKTANCLLTQLQGRGFLEASRLFDKLQRIDKDHDGAVDRSEFDSYVDDKLANDPWFCESTERDECQPEISGLAQGLWRFSAPYTYATTPPVEVGPSVPDAGSGDAATAGGGTETVTEVFFRPPRPTPVPSSMPQYHAGMVADRRRLELTIGICLAVGLVAAVAFAIYLRRWPRFQLIADLGKGPLRPLFRLRAGQADELVQLGLARRSFMGRRVVIGHAESRRVTAHFLKRQRALVGRAAETTGQQMRELERLAAETEPTVLAPPLKLGAETGSPNSSTKMGVPNRPSSKT